MYAVNQSHLGSSQFSLSYLCAGGSALLLAIAHLLPQLWFVLPFAAIPFLWRLCRVGPGASFFLGSMLAVSFLVATAFGELIFDPIAFLLQLLLLVAALATFSLAANKTGARLGYNPFFIALLWVPVGYFLIQYSNFSRTLLFTAPGSPFVTGLCSLIGILAASSIVVLANAAVLAFLTRVIRRMRQREWIKLTRNKEQYAPLKQVRPERIQHCYVHVRAPPDSYARYREAA